MTQKKTLGRQKIEIKKIIRKSNLQVAFTRRRNGLFNKASELCVLAGAEIAILVQSPGNHMYAFGYPNVESVIDTFLGNNVLNSSQASANPTCMHEEYNKMYLEIAKELEVEKDKLNSVEEIGESWWENSFEDLENDELEYHIESMERLKNNVAKKADKLRNLVTSTSFDTNMNASNVDGLNLVTSSSFDTNTNMSNVDGLNLVTGSSFNTNTDASNVDGLPDDQVILPNSNDQVILPNLDVFLPYNVGVTDEDLTRLQAFHNFVESGNYNFGNGAFVLDNHGDSNYQVSSDFSTIGVPNQNSFGGSDLKYK